MTQHAVHCLRFIRNACRLIFTNDLNLYVSKDSSTFQDALHRHQIDMKDLSQNHIDGKEFENAKADDTQSKPGNESKSSS